MTQNHHSSLLIVNYHYIRSRQQYLYPGIHPIEKDKFIEQVHWLKSRYHMATPEEVEAFAYGDNCLPGTSVFLTFDDGLVEHGELAKQLLESLKAKGAFFISSRPLLEDRALMVHKIHWLRATTPPDEFREQFFSLLPDRYRHEALDDCMTEKALRTYIYDTPRDARLKYMINFQLPSEMVDIVLSEMLNSRLISESKFCEDLYMNESQLKRLANDGHIIGSHGHSHTPFSKLDRDDLEEELQTNISYIQKITGTKPRWFSYPYGTDWSIPRDMDGLYKDCGFRIGFSLDKERKRWNTGEEHPYRLDRINTNHVKELCVP